MTHNIHDADTGAPDSDDLDNDGNPDGWDQDEVLGPMADYPGEIDISLGALSIPLFDGDALTAVCRGEDGRNIEFRWFYLEDNNGEEWVRFVIDDRVPEGYAMCGLTQNGAPILDLHQADALVYDRQTVCVRQTWDAVYTAPGAYECEGRRRPW
ncbi:hypothetical protein KKH24_02475, partial [Patescibacteria group bacterium]|nr:hypothetical protein [Patescibacteria group bacterium]